MKLHSGLPATTIRGYCQLAAPAYTACVPGQPAYLGPLILAQRDKAVRVLFRNMLPNDASGGKLFIPTDTTYMGAGLDPNGQPYAQNRATLHLHGGATPWISDGTPHQWTASQTETVGQLKGLSAANVPDMWFNPTTHLPVAAGTAGATNDPGPGNLTFYWTNQQGGRLMFYHDHAYGTTRLNVYAGEAAGYLIYDPVRRSRTAGRWRSRNDRGRTDHSGGARLPRFGPPDSPGHSGQDLRPNEEHSWTRRILPGTEPLEQPRSVPR